VIDERTTALRLIRATRHSPPGLAGADPARRRRYGAALEQFEELLRAAATAGSAARPLPLFYALAQAGVAIAAAHLTRNGGLLKKSHGLTFTFANGTLASAIVTPTIAGAFRDVAEASYSPALASGVSLPSLWASLPESSGDRLPGDSSPAALSLEPEDQPTTSLAVIVMTANADAAVHGFPESFGTAPDRIEYLKEYLQNFPTAAGWEPTLGNQLASYHDSQFGWVARLRWRLPESTGNAGLRFEYLLTKIAPRDADHARGWLRPSVCHNGQIVSPLMTWWALLFGLSNLARYHPESWVEMLAVDTCAASTTFEAMLEDGLAAVPRLVLAALTRP